MFARSVLVAAAALFLVTLPVAPAWAEPVSLAPTVISAEFQEELDDKYGVREIQYLTRDIERSLSRALERVGGSISMNAPVRIETTLEDARPNRPTMQQLHDTPGLDFGRSISIGGAKLSAIIRGADGTVLGEVQYRYYETDIRNVIGLSTWSDARRAFDRFARRVAEEYARVAN